MAKLIVEHLGRTWHIAQFPFRIGRAADNDLVLANAAPYHAVIEESADGLHVRAVRPCYVDGKAVQGERLLQGNARLSAGGAVLSLWQDAQAPMPPVAPPKRWAWVAHPVMAAFWFILALVIPLWLGYLSTPQRYVLDYQIIFTMTATIIALVWLMNAFLLPVVGRHLIIPLIGIVSWLSVLNDLADQAAYYFNFQLSGSGFNLAALLLSAGMFLWVLRRYLHDTTAIAGRSLNRYTFGAALPCLLLLGYTFLSSHDFFAERGGNYPSYHRELLPTMMPGIEAKPIDSLFDIKKTE